jgi:hypothetical protein
MCSWTSLQTPFTSAQWLSESTVHYEMSTFQYHTKLCSTCSVLVVYFTHFSPISFCSGNPGFNFSLYLALCVFMHFKCWTYSTFSGCFDVSKSVLWMVALRFSLLLLLSSSSSQALHPSAGYGLLVHEVPWSPKRRAAVGRTPFGRVMSSSQGPLPGNTQHTQQTNINAPGGIWTHDHSRRAVVELRLRRRGHWDRRDSYYPGGFRHSFPFHR